jgi:PAS domain S-box-containing protein
MDRFRILVEGLPLVAYLDTGGSADPAPEFWVSPRIEELTGYTAAEWAEGRLWPRVIHPEDRDRVLAAHADFLHGDADRWECQYRMVRKDGRAVWVRDAESRLRDAAGATLQIQGSWEDVSDRVAADERLRRSELLYRLMAESVPDAGFALFDRELRYTLAAGPVFHRLGVDTLALEGAPFGTTGEEAAVVTALRGRLEAALAGEHSEVELELRGRRLRSHIGPVTLGGELTGALIMSLDVTLQQEVEARYRLLAQSFPGGIALYDPALRYTLAEGGLADRLGLRELIGRPVGEGIGGPPLAEAARAALEGATTGLAVSADGVDLEMEVGPARDSADRIIGGMLVGRDVSERNAAQAALQESESRRERVLAAMLRAEDEERSRIAADLHDDTVQVMTAALLSLDRVTGAIARGDAARAVDLAATYRRTLAEAMERTRRLMFELRPPTLATSGLGTALGDLLEEAGRDAGFTPHVRCVPGRFGDIVESLVYRAAAEGVVNVRKHARAANVWLTCRRDGGWLEMSLRDDGRGFDPGVELRREARRLHLGLDSIAERVRLAGGRFAIHSAPGDGTLLRIALPLPDQADIGT